MNAFAASVVPTLRAVLRAEIEGHRALLSVLRSEQRALQAKSTEAVAAAAATARRYVAELELLAQQRFELLAHAGLTLTPNGIASRSLPAELASQIDEDWATLRAVATEARVVNVLNGTLLEAGAIAAADSPAMAR
jgi:flagellar biosynthesis protein FlgN